MWASVIKALLVIVVWIVKNKLDGDSRKEIAREIDKASASWTDADVDDRLRGYYRDDPRENDK